MTKSIILSDQEIKHTIKRIAYQIYETFVEEDEIVIAGIEPNGYMMADKIAKELESITSIKITLCGIKMNKQHLEQPLTTTIPKEQYTNKGVVIIDDVLNSGTVLIYAVRHFLEVPLKKLKTAVLVDRNHKKYPIKADFKGISLSTSLLEHVEVVFDDKEKGSYANLS